MLTGITFLLRWREEFILSVIVNHSFGKDLIIFVTLGGGKLFFHKGCHLIHV